MAVGYTRYLLIFLLLSAFHLSTPFGELNLLFSSFLPLFSLPIIAIELDRSFYYDSALERSLRITTTRGGATCSRGLLHSF
jgi:hypothetical protein